MQLRGSRPPIIEGRFFHSEKTAPAFLLIYAPLVVDSQIMRIGNVRTFSYVDTRKKQETETNRQISKNTQHYGQRPTKEALCKR